MPVNTGVEFEVGEMIHERYRVHRILGRGGMGVVYLAEDTSNSKMCALKALLPLYANNTFAVGRFEREVATLRKLEHPAIVRIYEAHKLDNLYYYTMDYVNGKSVVRWIREQGRLGVGPTVRVLALLADALNYAHRFTIHRDISPENVMVLADGSVRLLDFGLAKFTDGDATAFTMAGVNLGKIHYRAPEQELDPRSVDARADLFSLGVMFYAMLTGCLPKKGQKIADLVPGYPKEVDAFAERAMARSPDARFQTAREFRVALLDVYKACQEAEGRHAVAPTPAFGKIRLLAAFRAKWRRWRERRFATERPTV